MHARRRNANEHVTRANFLAVDELMLLHDADGEAAQVVLSPLIKVRHLCCLLEGTVRIGLQGK